MASIGAQGLAVLYRIAHPFGARALSSEALVHHPSLQGLHGPCVGREQVAEGVDLRWGQRNGLLEHHLAECFRARWRGQRALKGVVTLLGRQQVSQFDFQSLDGDLFPGARQVGKTFSVDAFGRERFDNVVRVDLERNRDWHGVFDWHLPIRLPIGLHTGAPRGGRERAQRCHGG